MQKKLTPQQEKFCKCVALEAMSATVAYREAYNPTDPKAEWVYEESRRTRDDPGVSQRIDELDKRVEEKSVDKALFTKEQAVDEYEEARVLAREEKKPHAMIQATTGKAKVAGVEGASEDNEIVIRILR